MASSSVKSDSTAARRIPRNYLERSELPLTSLLFLMPLLILYELGTRWYLSDPVGSTEQIRAFSLMQQFFQMFGATARHLPAVAVIVLLLSWHIARNDPWTLYPRTCLGMAVESCAMAIPLVVIGHAVMYYMQSIHLMASDSTRSLLILNVGAGIYEELVFRLIAFTALSFLLRDLLHLSKWTSAVGMVLISALLFSGYHYLGNEQFELPSFAFRTVAGIYLGGMFLVRGFGITVGAHAAYDIFITLQSGLISRPA
jgi:membrane protease YdiL (CAAX protease family)